MNNACEFKISYIEKSNYILFKGNLNDFPKYEQLIKKIFDASKNPSFKTCKVTEKDKFILSFDGHEIGGLTSVWNKDTYDYFFNNMKKKDIKKIKFNIKKVEEYPPWNPPKYHDIFKDSLKLSWNNTKKEIEKELTEKYLENGKRSFIIKKIENNPSLKEEFYKELHSNIICKNCLDTYFGGARYMCSECDNFNICENCKKNEKFNHKEEHFLIKFNNPVLVNIQKYNAIFFPNTQLIKRKNKEPFETTIEIIDMGENSLKGCFIIPIRFGKHYLGGIKTTIIDDSKKGEKIKVNLFIKFEDEEEEEYLLNFYEGYYRLFSKEGIPFGDIFYIKLFIEK